MIHFLCYPCSKFYYKRRQKLHQKKKDETLGETATNPSKAENGNVKSNYTDNKVLNANQAFNLAYDGSIDEDVPEDIRMAYGVPTTNG